MTALVEFCHGYGGATRGLLDAGLTIEAAYDIWPVAVAAHHEWMPNVPCQERDVATITPDELAGRFVWASLPCQPWSEANTRGDKRGKKHPHYYSLAHFARQVQHARCAVIENVPGLVYRKDGQAELRELEVECARLGLTVTMHLVLSEWFGVDQERKRVFIVIGRDLPLILIQPYAGRSGSRNPTVMASDGLSSSLHRRKSVVCATHGGSNGSLKRRAATVTAHPAGYNVWSGHKRTVTAAGDKRRSDEAEFIGARSIKECAELQGVPVPPKHFSRRDQFALVGNCVPPKLARAIAEQVFVPLLKVRA